MIAIKAVVRTGELQLRPVLMTCLVAGVGLLPVAPSIGIAGAEAACDRGGDRHDAGAAVILVTLPVLISFFSRRDRTSCPDGVRVRRPSQASRTW
jgi:heavy metal efflux system protein